MRVVTWNTNGATETSQLWTALKKLNPDVVLLQEVNGLPDWVKESFKFDFRKATNKSLKKQRFGTAVLVNGDTINPIRFSSKITWVNRVLDIFNGNAVSCVVAPQGHEPVSVVSVHIPHWSIKLSLLKKLNIHPIRTSKYSELDFSEPLEIALKTTISSGGDWLVGGDYNISKTFDVAWQKKHPEWIKKNGTNTLRLPGCACEEALDDMKRLGFRECLSDYNRTDVVPTFRNRTGGKVVHQIDHLFATRGLYANLNRCRVGDQREIFSKGLSDHLPIIAEFS